MLDAAYGPQHWWPANTPFEVILGAYFTQNTSWKAGERSLERFRSAGALTWWGARNSVGEITAADPAFGILHAQGSGAEGLREMLDKEFGGSLETMAAMPTAALRQRLLDLPGVGDETADAILLYALGHAVPVADEYLRRIAERHELVAPPEGRRRIPYDALAGLTRRVFAGDPEEGRAQLFNEFHALTVAVGKAHCGRTARCEGCPLAADLRHAS